MKNIILFLLGIIAILGIVAIVKNNYIFSFGDKERLDKGWKAYESKDYGFAISQFSAVDYNKHPEVILPLADSYLEINEVYNAIKCLESAYSNKNSYKDLPKITNMLGITYITNKDYKKARAMLLESDRLGNENSKTNLQILDSLEQVQNTFRKFAPPQD